VAFVKRYYNCCFIIASFSALSNGFASTIFVGGTGLTYGLKAPPGVGATRLRRLYLRLGLISWEVKLMALASSALDWID
jgi:hypothetical protein